MKFSQGRKRQRYQSLIFDAAPSIPIQKHRASAQADGRIDYSQSGDPSFVESGVRECFSGPRDEDSQNLHPDKQTTLEEAVDLTQERQGLIPEIQLVAYETTEVNAKGQIDDHSNGSQPGYPNMTVGSLHGTKKSPMGDRRGRANAFNRSMAGELFTYTPSLSFSFGSYHVLLQ